MPSGMLTRKIQRQLPTVAMAPPRTGASTGAASAGQVSTAIARTRSALPLKRNTASLPTGTIMAPPIPWAIRIPTSMGNDTLSAQPTEARVNTAMAAMNTARMPNRSAIQPLAGISTATVTRYAVIATLTSTASTPNCPAMAGIAGVRMLASRISMKNAPATNSATFRGNGGFSGAATPER